MKKILFSAIASLTLGGLIYFALSCIDSHDKVADDQIALITTSLETLRGFDESGDASAATSQLKKASSLFKETRQRALSLGEGSASEERVATIERLAGELLNSSINLVLSENAKAAEVSQALDELMSQ